MLTTENLYKLKYYNLKTFPKLIHSRELSRGSACPVTS